MGCCQSVSELDRVLAVLRVTPFQYRMKEEDLEAFAQYFEFVRYKKGRTIATVESEPSFFILEAGEVDLTYEGTLLTTKTKPGSFFGQLAFHMAGTLERKESLHAKRLNSNLDGDGAKKRNLGAAALTKRESEIENARLGRVVARTDVCAVRLSVESFEEYSSGIDERMRDILLATMGASTTKNLRSLPFLKSLSDRKIQVLSNLLHYVPLRKGDILFEEGSEGEELYIVYIGGCEAVATSTEDEDRIVLNRFREGDYFGELSLFLGIPRTAAIVATEESLLLELHKDDFTNFLKLTPNLPFHDLMKRRFANHFKKYKVPFFAAIPESKYPLLASLCSVDQYEPNTVIFREGDIGTRFYIIAHGEVVVTAANRDPKTMKEHPEVELCFMGPGKYFGEVALIRQTPRTATIRTTTRCVVLSITKEDFQKFFEEAPEALADFEVKLARYDCAMRSVIYHPVGVRYFTQFLEKEYSAENIHFWAAARDYRHIGTNSGPRSRGVTGDMSQASAAATDDSAAAAAETKASTLMVPGVEQQPAEMERERAQMMMTRSESTPADIHLMFKADTAKRKLRFSFSSNASSSAAAIIPEEDHGDNAHLYQNEYEMEKRGKAAGEALLQSSGDDEKLDAETKAMLLEGAQRICKHFIEEEAPEQVNIQGKERERILSHVAEGKVDRSTFKLAEKEILALIERDSFNRFKQSELFRQFLDEAESYDEERQAEEIKKSSPDKKLRSGSILHTQDRRATAVLENVRNERAASAAATASQGDDDDNDGDNN